MKEEFYLIDPGGEKVGPVDIVTLTSWARDGKILPDNTISDLEGNICKARDIITFVKVTPKVKNENINIKPFIISAILMGIICAVCVVGYMGIRINYDNLKKDNENLNHKYKAALVTVEELEKENLDLKKNNADFIQKMIKDYNLVESERNELKDRLNSLQEESKALKELKEALNVPDYVQDKEEPKKEEDGVFKGVPLPEDL